MRVLMEEKLHSMFDGRIRVLRSCNAYIWKHGPID